MVSRVSAHVLAGACVTTHFTTPIHSCLRSLFLFYYLENLLLFVYSHIKDPKKEFSYTAIRCLFTRVFAWRHKSYIFVNI